MKNPFLFDLFSEIDIHLYKCVDVT